MIKKFVFRLICFAIFALTSTQSTSAASDAREVLEILIAETADQISNWVKSEDASELAIGTIEEPAGASSGAIVAQLIREQLQATGLSIKRINARYTLGGAYYAANDNRSVTLDLFIRDAKKDNRKVKRFDKIKVTKPDVIAMLTGSTVAPPPTDPGSTSPPPSNPNVDAMVNGNVVHPKGNKDYGIEVLLKEGSSYRSRRPTIEEGFAFADIPAKGVYAVKIHNNTNHPIAVQLLIDGTSYFQYCQKRKKGPNGVDLPGYTHVIVGPKKAGMIKGWYVTSKKAYEFVVNEYGGAENHQVAPEVRAQSKKSNLGTITAMIYRTNTNRSFIPKRTGRGDEIDANYKLVKYKWEDNYHAAISVRYSK